jgi:Lipase maturation factor
MLEGSSYWYSRFVFERALAAIYLIAFLGAANQYVALLGEHGLLPIANFVRSVPFRATPSLFYLAHSDMMIRVVAWTGVALAAAALSGYPQQLGNVPAAVVWALLWVLYLSIVNTGQIFYGFGWESLLLEAGFFAIFAGSTSTTPSSIWVWMNCWILFRVMVGAGLIKLRGDPCWRDLTCLNYYFETQPIPNPLSWYFHWFPHVVHRAGVVFNHVVELGVPFLYFAPQPLAAIGGLLTIAFQLVLIISGNLSWLNWMTIVVAIPAIDDRWLTWLPLSPPDLRSPSSAHRALVVVVGILVLALSVKPTMNMLSPHQMMNYSFNPIHLVNTYGAFGSITRTRYEIVIEGTSDSVVTGQTEWRAYEFKGKPGDPSRRPLQIAPYHLRLDWLMWFAAMSPPSEHPWFTMLLVRLLEGNREVLGLLRANPFADKPPRWVRAIYYKYRFTTPDERRKTGEWWVREQTAIYVQPIALAPSTKTPS